MANYGLYKNIDPATLSSDAAAILENISRSGKSINDLNNSLSDSIWKCGAKSTLKEGLSKISGVVLTDITTSINNLVTVAGYISSYKEAEQQALNIKSSLANTPNTPENAGTISALQSDLSIAETNMNTYEGKVKGMI